MEPLLYQGVSNQGDGTYSARIVSSGHTTQLGTYKTPEDAARAYDVAALALFETSAVTNFPMEAYSFAEVAMAKRSLAGGGGMSCQLLPHAGAPGSLTGSPVKQYRQPQGSLAAADVATPEAEPLANAPPTREQPHPIATATAPGSTPNKRRHLALSAGEHKFQSMELPNRGVAGGLPAAAAPATLLQQQIPKRSNSSTSAQAAAASPTNHAQFSTLSDVQDVQEQAQPRVSPDHPITAAPAGTTKDQLQQHLLALNTAGKADLLVDKLPRSPADLGHGPAALHLRDQQQQQQQQQPVVTSDNQQQLQQEEPDLLASLIRSADSGRFACARSTAAAGDGYADRAGKISQQPSNTTVDLQLQWMNSSSSMGSPSNAGIHAPARPPNRRKPSSSSITKDEQQQQQPVAVPALRRGSSRASASAASWGWTAGSAAEAAEASLGSGAAGTSYRGIILRRNGRYDGRLTVLGVKLYLGVFEDPADAAAAYDLAALALYEHNAATNFPRSNYSAAAVAARRAELLSKLANHQNIGGSQAGQQAREWAAAQLAKDQQQQQEKVGQQWEFAELGHLPQTAVTLVPSRTQAVGRARAAAVAAAAVAAARVGKRVSGGISSSGRPQDLVPGGVSSKKPRLGAALAAAAAGDTPGHRGGSSRSRSRQQQTRYMSGSGVSAAAAAAASINVDGLWGEYVAHNDVLSSLFSLIEAAASVSPAAHAAAAAAAAAAAGKEPTAGTAAAAAVSGQFVRDPSAHPGNRSSQQQQQQPATPVRPLAMLLSCLSPRGAAAAAGLPAAADPMDLDDRDTLAEALLAGSAAKSIKTESPVAEEDQNPRAQNPRAQNPINLEVCWGGNSEDEKPIKAEQNESVASLKERSSKLFGLDADKVEIWDFFHRVQYASLEDKLDETLEEARVLEGQSVLLVLKDAPLDEDTKPPAPVAAAAAPITGLEAAATAATAVKATKANESAEQCVSDHDPAAGTGLCDPAPPAAADGDVDVCQALVADAFSSEQQQQRSGYCSISSPVCSDGKPLSVDAGQHIELPAAAAAGTDEVGPVPGQPVVNSSASPPAAAAAAAIQSAFSATRQISPAAAAGAADRTKVKRLLRSLSSGSSTGRGSRSSSTTPAPMEVAAAAEGHDQPAAGAAAGADLTNGSDNSQQATKQTIQQDRRKGRKSRFSKSPPAVPQAAAAAAAAAKPSRRKVSPSPSLAAAAADVDNSAAAGAGSSSGTTPATKSTGPGSVSHSQNPTGNQGVRSRKAKFEAFLATPPFRYLYLGQYDTVDAAVAARDAAMLALYGPGAVAAHGTAWVSATAAADAAVEGSAAAAAVLDMAAKLMKKDNVPGVMKDNGTEYLLDVVRERQQQQQKERIEKRAAAAVAAEGKAA